MKQRLADYVRDFFIGKGIEQVFTVVGGGAMHLNDSFGHDRRLKVLYHHHEQAASMAAEAYAKVADKPALVCVTSGPGAINALNGVAGAYQDSIPMLVVSGQMKSTLTVRKSGLKLRTLGGQEFNIVSALGEMTKYAEMVLDPERIRYCLEKAWHLANTGRKGPCWLDIPVDIQGMQVETEELNGIMPEEMYPYEIKDLKAEANSVLDRLRYAERPVLYAGNGIRLSGAANLLPKLVEALDIPVVTCWDSIDLIPTDSRYYCGRGGTMGDRAGNFAVQNSDFLLTIGSRLSIYQVGYNVKTWARAAYTVVVDIDPEELKKQTVRIDQPVCADARRFMESLVEACENNRFSHSKWLEQCNIWKRRYPVVRQEQKDYIGRVNVYAFMDELSRMLPVGTTTVVTNGSASVVGSHSYYIGKNNRFVMNCAISSMGYGLPAAIGAARAAAGMVVCIEGDGSIMMNLQELQTIVTNRLPIKIFLINNNGYHQIRQTQNNIFHNGLIGVGPESGDLGFPDFEKIALAFGMPYVRLDDNQDMKKGIQKVLDNEGYILCEVMVTQDQRFEPKSATRRLPDGKLTSPPLEDMAPFLSREELKENMYIPLVEE